MKRCNPLFPGDIRDLVVTRSMKTDACYFAVALRGELEGSLAIAVDNDLSARRNYLQHLPERIFNSRQICIEIGMVKFNGVENHGCRKIMHKLRAAIHKSCVILIALNNEIFTILFLVELKAAA